MGSGQHNQEQNKREKGNHQNGPRDAIANSSPKQACGTPLVLQLNRWRFAGQRLPSHLLRLHHLFRQTIPLGDTREKINMIQRLNTSERLPLTTVTIYLRSQTIWILICWPNAAAAPVLPVLVAISTIYFSLICCSQSSDRRNSDPSRTPSH